MLLFVWLLPQWVIRAIVGIFVNCLYRLRIYGQANLPASGGALIISNHVSWLDGILMMYVVRRPVRMLVYEGNFHIRWLRRLADRYGAIQISPGPKSIAKALRAAREAIERGELVGIFPEGGVTRTGQLQGFRAGFLRIVEGTDAPIIPMYIDGLWGSIFSYRDGKLLWKWPRAWPYPVSIHIGTPIRTPASTFQVRQVISEMGALAIERRIDRLVVPPRRALRALKRKKWQIKVADSTGQKMSGGSALMRGLILRRLLRRHVLQPDERRVGVLLPPSVGGVLTNLALALDRRQVVNLNYTMTSATLNHCLHMADVRHVITSRRVMEKLNLAIDVPLVYLEDLREKVSPIDKVSSAFAAYLTPACGLEWSLGLHRIRPDEVMTIIFTSGSTGVPKGAMLSHANIGTNVEAVDEVIQLRPTDTVVGVLPFFHSFGYTVTLWTVLAKDVKGVYHYSPLDARQIGDLTRTHQANILLSTPTFLRSYLRRCEPDDFRSLQVVVAGAEQLPRALCDAFEERFGVRPLEGYGTTELSPLVSVNVPASRVADGVQPVARDVSVGRPVPHVAAEIRHLDTGEVLAENQDGMLWIRGPNVMLGYLNEAEKTAAVLRDGWYQTGDVARIDEEGFIHITGRQSRFSKIGGEMVPHLLIEEALTQLVRDSGDDSAQVAVTALPDEKKGERLVVVHTPLPVAADELCARLRQSGLPNVFVPAADSFLEVEQLPLLGSGKLDLSGLKSIAVDRLSPTRSGETPAS